MIRSNKQLKCYCIIAVSMMVVVIYFPFFHKWLFVEYVQPSGLVKELFPREEYVPYVIMKFSNGFRYPLEVDLREVAKRRLQGEDVNVKIINPHPFRYIHNPENLCSEYQENHNLRLLILVKSAASHDKLRHVIRSTWGTKVREHNHLEFAFLLGYSDLHEEEVERESKLYGDIIQENFVDTYLNNTFKIIMAYNWVVEHCSQARMVLFLDDDVYLNFHLLIYYLSKPSINAVTLFSGYISPFVETCRVRGVPWYMSWSDFPYDRYPDYFQGTGVFASMDVVKLFQAAFPYVRFFILDDVFLGIVAYKLNIPLSRNPFMENSVSNHEEQIRKDSGKSRDNFLDLIVAHGFHDPEYYLQTYNRQFSQNEQPHLSVHI